MRDVIPENHRQFSRPLTLGDRPLSRSGFPFLICLLFPEGGYLNPPKKSPAFQGSG